MNCAANETPALWSTEPDSCFIVGFGNPLRRDDGLGSFVVQELERRLKVGDCPCFLVSQQLEADLIEDLYQADLVLFVDASVEYLEEGWRLTKVQPEFGPAPYLTHTIKPEFFLGLMNMVYHKNPAAWLVSIQGDDFGFGQGLSPGAEKRANQVIAALVKAMSKEE